MHGLSCMCVCLTWSMNEKVHMEVLMRAIEIGCQTNVRGGFCVGNSKSFFDIRLANSVKIGI